MNYLKSLIATTVLASSFAATAENNIHINAGFISVMPNADSNYLGNVEDMVGLNDALTLDVDDNTQIGLTIDYDINENWTLELIAATPFSHDILVKDSSGTIDGLLAGETKHLPPTLMAQYHFGTKDNQFRPFVGAGLNYTIFFEEDVSPLETALLGADNNALALKLDDSVGLALQAGFNYKLNDKWGINAMAAWADISAEGGVYAGKDLIQAVDVTIDPLILMVGARYSF